jgi:hypothetical protein
VTKNEEKPAEATQENKIETAVNELAVKNNALVSPPREIEKPTAPPLNLNPNGTKVSAFSLASIKAKKDLEAQQQIHKKQHDELPTEAFTETDMLLVWNKFAKKLTENNKRLMATYMQMNDPKLNGSIITLVLPNESTKEEFVTGSHELLGYLRGKLHNHDIKIEVIVNESETKKYAFTPQDKYERLKEINPNLEKLRKMFDLDF